MAHNTCWEYIPRCLLCFYHTQNIEKIHICYSFSFAFPISYSRSCSLHVSSFVPCYKARVEGSIVELFLLKEIIYFSCVYFTEEHNVNVLILRYDIDEEPPLSDLKIFNRGAQLQAVARHIIILKKNERLLCCTYIAIWKRWNRISCKCLLYFLAP
jgi:hypothetical protein